MSKSNKQLADEIMAAAKADAEMRRLASANNLLGSGPLGTSLDAVVFVDSPKKPNCPECNKQQKDFDGCSHVICPTRKQVFAIREEPFMAERFSEQ